MMDNQQLLNTLTNLEEYEADILRRLSSIRGVKEQVHSDITARGGIEQVRRSCAIKNRPPCSGNLVDAAYAAPISPVDLVAPVRQEELSLGNTARANDDVVLAPGVGIRAHLCQLLERYSQGSVTTRNLTVMLMTRPSGPYYNMKFDTLRVKVQQAMAKMRDKHTHYWRLQWSHKSARNSQEYFYWWKAGKKK